MGEQSHISRQHIMEELTQFIKQQKNIIVVPIKLLEYDDKMQIFEDEKEKWMFDDDGEVKPRN